MSMEEEIIASTLVWTGITGAVLGAALDLRGVPLGTAVFFGGFLLIIAGAVLHGLTYRD